jgi:phage baseplate assembly protein V
MTWWHNLLRRARLRGLTEGNQVQVARAEALDDDAKDDAERWQDYGFAGNPVDGQGLVINAGGHTVVIRMDRLAERPHLDAFEVAVWHKEGHFVKLKAGGVIEVVAPTKVLLQTPLVEATGTFKAPVIVATSSLQAAGKELVDHHHGGVVPGGGLSGTNT